MSDERKGSIGGSFTFGAGNARGDAASPMPFRLLVLGDFGGATARDRPQPIDKEQLAPALAGAGVKIALRLPNLLGTNPAFIDATLAIADFKDFTPARLAAQIPIVAAALALHAKLASFAAGKLARDRLEAELGVVAGLERMTAAVREALGAPMPAPSAAPPAGANAPAAVPPRAPAATDDDLDRLLDMVDAPAAKPAPPPPAASALISAVLGDSRGYRAIAGAAEPLKLIEGLIAAQLDAVLADPQLAAIEAAWLGLRFMIRRADFRAPIRVERLDVPKDEAGELLHRVVLPAEAVAGGTPLGAVIAAYAYTLNAADIGKLARLAEAGEELMAPVVAGLGEGILGTDDAAAIARLRDPGSRIEAAGGDPWNALREKSSARWLTVVANPFALRAAADTSAMGFTAPPAPLAAPRWGNPAWAVASLMLESTARLGWATEIVGRQGGMVENLDLIARDVAGTAVQLSVGLPLSADAAIGLAEAGVAALAGERDRDAAWLVRAATVYRPGRLPDDDGRLARLFASLPYQLMTARVGRAISDAKPALAGREPAVAAAALEAMLRQLLENTGAGASAKVAVAADPDDSARVLLDVAVRTGAAVLGGAPLYLDLPL